MDGLIVVTLAVLGLVFGSFVGATIWRIRAHMLVADKKAGEQVSTEELRTLKPLVRDPRHDRSQCLHCGHVLAWYDLVPILSWASTGGKCRYCGQDIGYLEPLIEFGTATLFVLSFIFWRQIFPGGDPIVFLLWLSIVLLLVILFAYDAKWFILPDVIVFPLIGLSVVFTTAKIFAGNAPLPLVGALFILPGLYFLLYQFSKTRFGKEKTWIGFGDVKLCVALALLLGDWRQALLALFLANFLGVLLLAPSLIMKRVSIKTHVPFGPLLIAGFFIASFLGTSIIEWYTKLAM